MPQPEIAPPWERERMPRSGVTLGVPGSTPGRGIFRVEGWVLPIVRNRRLHDAPFRRLTCDNVFNVLLSNGGEAG